MYIHVFLYSMICIDNNGSFSVSFVNSLIFTCLYDFMIEIAFCNIYYLCQFF